MKCQRFKLETVILTAAAIMVTYMLSIMLGLRLQLILGLYAASTATTLWMVFRILKDPYTTDKTFDDYFYQDRPDLRRNGSE
ncbi:MAG TPA: hypothetical protein VF988_14535 [Verrucomicrobiae bacterium]